MVRRLSGVLAACLWFYAIPLAADWEDDDPRYWLQRMVDAARTVSFAGELVYAQGSRLDTLFIARLHEARGPRERIYGLSGPGLEILRADGRVTRIFPADRTVMVDHSESRRRLTDLTSEQIRQLESWYTVSLAGEGRVADRPATRLTIQPRDDHRYGYRLWLDRETGLLLRSQILNPDGDILEQFLYVDILFDDVDRTSVTSVLNHEGFRQLSVEPAPDQDEDGSWVATDAPAGFQLLIEGWWHMPGGGEAVRHLLFGDGLGSVSVYIAPPSSKPFHGLSGNGAMHVAGQTVDGHQVTVVGDVPANTVVRILEGLELRP